METPSAPRPLRPDDGRLERGRRSRAQIRAAARALFREKGFDGATLRAIAERAGMGASSIYRHIRSKEELLVEELAELQERAWREVRARGGRSPGARPAVRATTHPGARVARQVLALQERSVGLLTELLQPGRVTGELRRDADVLAAARTIVFFTSGARIAWANGLLDAEGCRSTIAASVELLFEGIAARPRA